MGCLKRLKRVKITMPVIVLLSCVCCGAMAAGVKPALAALAPPAGERCSMTWVVERQPAGVMLGLKIECPQLMRLRPITRLPLSPIDRKW